MGKNQKKKAEKRKRKQTSPNTPSPRPEKMADNSNSDTKLKQPYNNMYNTPDQSIGSSNVLSAAHNTLYGAYQGYPFTPYNQPPAPHTTPAHIMTQQLQPIPSPPPIQTHPQLDIFMNTVTEKLKKLDILDDILSRVVTMENHFNRMDNEMSEIKQKVNTSSDTIVKIDRGLLEAHDRIKDVDRQMAHLRHENETLKEKSIQQQARSMRDNLIFRGIQDTYDPEENTEETLVNFIKTELEIQDEINFHVVHRLKPKPDKSPRGIVAKFERRKDKHRVLSAAIYKLKDKPNFGVHDQYPTEIIERRKQLIPFLKDARQKQHRAVLKEDKLFIDGRRFIPRGPFVPDPPDYRQSHSANASPMQTAQRNDQS